MRLYSLAPSSWSKRDRVRGLSAPNWSVGALASSVVRGERLILPSRNLKATYAKLSLPFKGRVGVGMGDRCKVVSDGATGTGAV
jgi:hypothetical protein